MPNLQAAKLEAILRVMLDADSDEELHRARRQAARIAALDDGEIESLLAEYGESPHDDAPERYDDAGDPRDTRVVRHLREPAAARRHARDGEADDDDGGELARFYAALFNAYEAGVDGVAGREVADDEYHRAIDELHPLGWSLDRIWPASRNGWRSRILVLSRRRLVQSRRWRSKP